MTIVKGKTRDMTADDMKAEFAREYGVTWPMMGEINWGAKADKMWDFVLGKLAQGRLTGDE